MTLQWHWLVTFILNPIPPSCWSQALSLPPSQSLPSGTSDVSGGSPQWDCSDGSSSWQSRPWWWPQLLYRESFRWPPLSSPWISPKKGRLQTEATLLWSFYFVHDVLADSLWHGLNTGIMFEVNQNFLIQIVWMIGWDISDIIGGMTNKLFKIWKTPTNCSIHVVVVKNL